MSYQSQPLRFVSFRLVHLQIDKWPCPGSWARNKEPNPRKPPCSLSLGWKRFWRKVVRTKWYCSGSPGEVEEVKVGKIVIESCNRARWFEWDHGGINVGEMKKYIYYTLLYWIFFYYSVHLYKLMCWFYSWMLFGNMWFTYWSACPRQPHQCRPPSTHFPPSPTSALTQFIPRWIIVIITFQRKEATASGKR